MAKSLNKSEKNGFIMGVVYSVALLIRTQCEGGAETLWKESGFTMADLKGCDSYDTDAIKEYFKKMDGGETG